MGGQGLGPGKRRRTCAEWTLSAFTVRKSASKELRSCTSYRTRNQAIHASFVTSPAVVALDFQTVPFYVRAEALPGDGGGIFPFPPPECPVESAWPFYLVIW